MKQHTFAVLASIIIAGCTEKEKYAEFGVKGNIKTVTNYQYTQPIEKSGEWQPADTTQDHTYIVDKYDKNGLAYEQEFHVVISKDYLHTLVKKHHDDNKNIKHDMYDAEGNLVQTMEYTCTTENTYTVTGFDTEHNITSKGLTQSDNQKRKLLDDFTLYDEGTETKTRTEFRYVMDTTFIVTTNKLTGKQNRIKRIIVKRDVKGNPTTKIDIAMDSSYTQPISISIIKYEYYNQ